MDFQFDWCGHDVLSKREGNEDDKRKRLNSPVLYHLENPGRGLTQSACQPQNNQAVCCFAHLVDICNDTWHHGKRRCSIYLGSLREDAIFYGEQDVPNTCGRIIDDNARYFVGHFCSVS